MRRRTCNERISGFDLLRSLPETFLPLVTESSCCKSVRRYLNLSGFLIGGSSCRERGCRFGATPSSCPGDLWRIEVAFQASACANCNSQNIPHCRLLRHKKRSRLIHLAPQGGLKRPKSAIWVSETPKMGSFLLDRTKRFLIHGSRRNAQPGQGRGTDRGRSRFRAG